MSGAGPGRPVGCVPFPQRRGGGHQETTTHAREAEGRGVGGDGDDAAEVLGGVGKKIPGAGKASRRRQGAEAPDLRHPGVFRDAQEK
eukprot:591030-Rhodomonas_salina.1